MALAGLSDEFWEDEADAVAGGTCCAVIQQCTGTILDDAVGPMGCGCFILVAGRRAWYWRVCLSGPPSYSEVSRAATCGG